MSNGSNGPNWIKRLFGGFRPNMAKDTVAPTPEVTPPVHPTAIPETQNVVGDSKEGSTLLTPVKFEAPKASPVAEQTKPSLTPERTVPVATPPQTTSGEKLA